MKLSPFLDSTSATTLLIWGVIAVSSTTMTAQALEYGDRWNYDTTQTRNDGFVDYGPSEWGRISCDERSVEGLDACLAYRDKWHTGQDWEIEDNYCRWCPADRPGNCGRHHMSPINLERKRGLGYWDNDGNPGDGAHPEAKECIDVHWMKYEDSWCSMEHLIEADAFTIERHALRITQPITVLDQDTDELRIDCHKPGRGRKFGRIDYSRGFSQWWFLSHIDVHTPSEHTQEGKRYDAELQLQHFYSVNASTAGVANEMGTVSIFLQAYDDVPPYRYLDKVICQWRRHEYETRQGCNLPPVSGSYPGCFPHQRRRNMMRREQQPPSSSSSIPKKKAPYQTIYDWILAKERQEQEANIKTTNNQTLIPTLVMDGVNFEGPEMTDEQWADFIAKESAKFQADEDLWNEVHFKFKNDTVRAHEEFHKEHDRRRHRQLIEGEEIEWFNYFPMLGVRTEYYYRYSGSQTIPPCYGNFDPNSRQGTNHWRVLKDPIRIHPRQLAEMKRLLAERIAPRDAPTMACQKDTAAKVRSNGNVVDTARPLQYTHPSHFKVFCECKDWPSKWPEDRQWCDIDNINDRFYKTPYNFETSGF